MDGTAPSATDWREEKYSEVFEGSLQGLERRRDIDPSFSLADAEGILHHLYVQDGNDWTGRGELQDLILAATIAAYEHYIAEWKAGALEPEPPEQEQSCR